VQNTIRHVNNPKSGAEIQAASVGIHSAFNSAALKNFGLSLQSNMSGE
jgi:hypothetical protein